MSAPQKLMAHVDPEPADRSVIIDDRGRAWQRDGESWLPCGAMMTLLGPSSAARRWADVLLNRGPVTVIWTPPDQQ